MSISIEYSQNLAVRSDTCWGARLVRRIFESLWNLAYQIWKLNKWENYSFTGYQFYVCFDELDSIQFLSRLYQNSEMCQFDIVYITMGKLIYFTSHVYMEICLFIF